MASVTKKNYGESAPVEARLAWDAGAAKIGAWGIHPLTHYRVVPPPGLTCGGCSPPFRAGSHADALGMRLGQGANRRDAGVS